jgi:radical SAM protein (TIGR01212 family)
MTPFNSEKHYHTLNNYYLRTFGKKVFKISLNAGFTCPNIDGTVGVGGCSFCSPLGSGDFAGQKTETLEKQFNTIKDIMHQKWRDGYYIAYFQANSNTYAPVEKLKQVYEQVLNLDTNIKMISIGTRCDCLDDDILTYLGELNEKIPVQVELGLQTIHQTTSDLINRGHDLKCFTTAITKLRRLGLEVVVHIINGLPYETKKMMLETIQYVNQLDIQGVKIHMLHIMQKTKMGLDYLKQAWDLLTLDEFVEITVNQLRLLRPEIVIHRLGGDAPKDLLIAPLWTLKKLVVNNEIDKLMRKHHYYQGDLL